MPGGPVQLGLAFRFGTFRRNLPRTDATQLDVQLDHDAQA
jgi:hypothetical protein